MGPTARLLSRTSEPAKMLYGVFILLGSALPANADPADAVVRISSHGCSGTVIATGPGQTWVLTCAHAFEGGDRHKPLSIDMPAPLEGHEQRGGSRPRVVKVDYRADLCLIRLDAGPLPFWAGVGDVPPRPGDAFWAVGHAGMKWPGNRSTVHVIDVEGQWTHTAERPRSGDSGGPLLDRSGALVGTCTGFESGTRGRGMYVSLPTIRRFLGLQEEKLFRGQPLTPSRPQSRPFG
jgi:hypothetical protein